MNKNKFKWAVLGPGRIAERFAGGLAAIDDAELYAVASRNEARASRFAKKFGAEVTYSSYETMLADDNIDAVYIATPHRFTSSKPNSACRPENPPYVKNR